jgi:superfamily II DNA or RNA helicase
MLKNLNIKKSYKTPRDDIARDFLTPSLSVSVNYSRSVAYFSSKTFLFISSGIKKIIENKGKINLIVSPELSLEDLKTIENAYFEKNNLKFDLSDLKEIEKSLFFDSESEIDSNGMNILFTLIKKDILNVKVSFSKTKDRLSLFHEKIGIITDKLGDSVVFTGSMNDTENGYFYNYESIDIFKSWEDMERVEEKKNSFEDLWNNSDPNAIVLEISEKLLNLLEKKGAKQLNDGDLYESLEILKLKNNEYRNISIPNHINLYEYQKEAINNWSENNYIGIFDMATGTGKTITAISAAVKLIKEKKRIILVIVCPYLHLLDQWSEDLIDFGFKPIIASHDNQNYFSEIRDSLYEMRKNINNNTCIIVTNASYSRIIELIKSSYENLLLIVDEAHNFGSENLFKLLDDKIKYRIALSATIERHRDEIGTSNLNKYFDKKIIEFGLEKAISGGFLTQYYYYPIVVYFNENELEDYKKLSKEMSQCWTEKSGKRKLSERGKIIAQKRSRLVAGLSSKVTKINELIEKFKDKNHLLIYCGATKISDEVSDYYNQRQIDVIAETIWVNHKIRNAKFTSEEDNKLRLQIKKDFSEGEKIQALVAIKCLDEGVNIPEIETVFLLASTSNPKEYIQRRGRVLRKSKNKRYAYIYDFITLPRPLTDCKETSQITLDQESSLVKNELNRINEFYRLAINKYDSINLINEINNTYTSLNKHEEETL